MGNINLSQQCEVTRLWSRVYLVNEGEIPNQGLNKMVILVTFFDRLVKELALLEIQESKQVI